MLSVLILTFNEEHNLPACLESVCWSDDVLVLDSFSTDRTVEIARAAGARVMQRVFDDFASQRNFGIVQGGLKHDWVLHIDADEVVTQAMFEEMKQVIASGKESAYRIPSKMMFQGQWLKYSGMYPTYQVRFGRRDKLSFVQVGHGQRESLPAREIGTLKEPLLHYSFNKGLEDWFSRHNRYSTAESLEGIKILRTGGIKWGFLLSGNTTCRRRALKELSVRLPGRALVRFLYMYLFRLGFLDGVAGLRYCQLLTIYESMIALKIKELEWQKNERTNRLSGQYDYPLLGGK